MPQVATDFVSPPEIVGVTSAFFGGRVDLDPASSKFANTLINAARYFTAEDNGLRQTWKAKNVYLYPPRDSLTYDEQPPDTGVFRRKKRFVKSAQRVWLEECYRQYLRNNFEEAIVFLTSTEVALITTQKLGLDFPICVLKEKPALHLDKPDLPKISNTRCYGFILYMPESTNPDKRVRDFFEFYSPLGRVYC
jgi:hypothetical protein